MKKETLPNGLTAISAYSQLPYIGVGIGVNYGYIDDEEEKSGKGHFLEHMIFKGTYKRTADQIRKELIEYTFMTNGYINPEATFYIAEVRNKDALDKILELLSDMIRNSILGENEMEMEKKVILTELSESFNYPTPKRFALYYLPKCLFRHHPAKRTPLGSEKTISKVTRDDILKIYEEIYGPQNMVVVIYGGIKEEEGINKIIQYFGDWTKSSKVMKREIANEPQERNELIIENESIVLARMAIGFKTTHFKENKDLYALEVLNDILSKRLYKRINKKMHLAGNHYPTSFNFPYSTFGFIAATLETKSKDIENTKESILKEFQFVESGEIEYKEVEKSKREIIETKEGNFQMKYIPRGLRKIVEYEDSFTTSFKIAEYHLFGGDVYNFFNYTNQIAAVTLDDIREVANKFIRADKYGMVVLKPK